MLKFIFRIFLLPMCYILFVPTSIFPQDNPSPLKLNIPVRDSNALTGSQFMNSVSNLSFEEREQRIFEEISNGNIPSFLRKLFEIEYSFTDVNGKSHSVKYWVMPDYLTIGSDEDFCRIPMGPITAQKLADLFGATLPTPKLVDNIYLNSEVKLDPQFYAPIENQNELVSKFVLHNKDIEKQRIEKKGKLGKLIAGIKKDVVICGKLSDSTRTHHVTIYGWHKLLDGKRIQPIFNGHIDSYVDYSHGVRLIKNEILIDSFSHSLDEVLKDEKLFKLLSNENSPLTITRYKNRIYTKR